MQHTTARLRCHVPVAISNRPHPVPRGHADTCRHAHQLLSNGLAIRVSRQELATVSASASSQRWGAHGQTPCARLREWACRRTRRPPFLRRGTASDDPATADGQGDRSVRQRRKVPGSAAECRAVVRQRQAALYSTRAPELPAWATPNAPAAPCCNVNICTLATPREHLNSTLQDLLLPDRLLSRLCILSASRCCQNSTSPKC